MSKSDKLLSQLQSHLDTGEEILQAGNDLMVVVGTYETQRLGQDGVRTGSLMATNQRLIFFAKKLGGFEMESFPYKSITSIEQSKGLMGGQIRIISSGDTAVIKWVKDVNALTALAQVVREQLIASPNSQSAVTNVSSSVVEQIKQLAELHSSGLLTDDEFAATKKDLLDRM